MTGYYRMHRGWMENPVFGSGPYSRRDAWCWLIEKACWRETRVDVAGKTVMLERGQLSHSLRYIAEAWDWDKMKVSRYLTRLKADTMIETRLETGQMVCTILNYAKYQADAPESETPAETTNETLARQDRDTSETNKKEPEEVKKEERKATFGSPKKPDPFDIPDVLKRDAQPPPAEPDIGKPITGQAQPPAEQTEPKARAKRRTRLPAGWADEMPDHERQAAIRHGLDPPAIEFHWGEFTRGALTHGRLYERWDLAWITWMGNIEKYSGGRKNGYRTHDSDTERDRQTRSALADSVRAELEAERSGAG